LYDSFGFTFLNVFFSWKGQTVMKKVFLTFTAFFFPLLFCLVTEGFARDVTLQWDANTETDLAGYKIYYKTTSSGAGVLSNYTGVGAEEGNSPVDMPLAMDENPDIDVVEFTLHDLDDDQTYFFVVTAHNTGGLESSASNEAHSDPPSSDMTPPVISTVQVSAITYNSAVVAWMTDEQSTSLVQYGTSSNTWGNYPSSASNSSMVTTHSVTLTGLSSSTTYYFRVGSTDAAGNGPTTSSQATFTTNQPPDTTPPVISNVRVSTITHNSAVVTWMTDEQSTSLLRYGTSSNTWGNYPNSAGNSSMVTSHSVTLTALSGSTTYYFRVGSTDATGNGPTISAETSFITNSTPDLEVQGLPVNLTGGTPQSAEVELSILDIPSGTVSIELTMTVRDPDFSNEGRLFINGHGPIILFGAQGISAQDGISVTLSPFATDPAWYQSGQNILTFWHDSTGGYVVEAISVSFITSQPGTTPTGLPCGLRIGNR
jgi:hypothetical protein